MFSLVQLNLEVPMAHPGGDSKWAVKSAGEAPVIDIRLDLDITTQCVSVSVCVHVRFICPN